MSGPDITGGFTPWGPASYQGRLGALEATGAFKERGTALACYKQSLEYSGATIDFSASKSSSVFGKATTVQPSTVRFFSLIKF